MKENILEVQNLKKYFGSGNTLVKAVDDISLQVKSGEIVLIMGPSGSGKTTLISMIGMLMKPSSGTVTINGLEVSDLKENRLPDIRRRNIGFIFQSFQLLSSLTAFENVIVPTIGSLKSTHAKSQAKKLFQNLTLQTKLNSLPKNLSGGEKQRIAIARALINNPNIILADEPTANLDSKNGEEVMNMLCTIACKEQKAVIIVSHDERLKYFAQRIIHIEDGKLVQEEKGQHNTWCGMHHPNGR